jgi:hypothetical protein
MNLSSAEIRDIIAQYISSAPSTAIPYLLERSEGDWLWVCYTDTEPVRGWARAWAAARKLAKLDGVAWRVRAAGEVKDGRLSVARPGGV